MRVAVTGASGHVGSNLVRELLARGATVRALVHEDARGLEGLAVERRPGVVTDADAVQGLAQGADVFFHLAAKISLDPAVTPLMQSTNVGGPTTVVAAVRAAGVRRLVHVSSIHAYSSEPTDVPIDEERPLATGKGLLAYDASKAAGEQVVRAAIGEGLDAVIVNPTGIIGPNDFRPSHMGEVLLDLYHRRLPGLVAGAFDWVDVRDVTAGILAAAERAPRGGRYLLGGHRATIRELAVMAEQLTGKRRPRMVSPMWLARAVAPFAVLYAKVSGRRPLFTPYSLMALRNHRDVSHSRAERELGYQTRPLEETLRDTYAWFEAAGMLQP